MELESLKYVGAGLATLGMIGAGAGLGNLFGKYFEAISRQPAVESKIKTTLFIGLALVEAIALLAFVMGILIWSA